MRLFPVVLLLALVGPTWAQPVEGASLVRKSVYTLASPDEAGDPPAGALRRSEVETYSEDGRRLRVEWRDPEGALILSFVEFYDASDRPFGALYIEGADLEATVESYTFLDDGQRKRVTYSTAAGEVTSVNEFVSDDQGREVLRRYGTAEGEMRATDTVTYEGLNPTGYVNERLDGSRRVVYTYRTETVDDRGRWTSRVVLRDGAPSVLEVREITYASLRR